MIMEESEMMSSMICRAEDRLGSTESPAGRRLNGCCSNSRRRANRHRIHLEFGRKP